jgi:hypothetical protein
MSRSYKRMPVSKEGKSAKKEKRYANHLVRRHQEEIGNGCHYRRLFQSYDIHDFSFYQSYAMWAHYRERFINREQSINVPCPRFYQTDKLWKKYYFRK